MIKVEQQKQKIISLHTTYVNNLSSKIFEINHQKFQTKKELLASIRDISSKAFTMEGGAIVRSLGGGSRIAPNIRLRLMEADGNARQSRTTCISKPVLIKNGETSAALGFNQAKCGVVLKRWIYQFVVVILAICYWPSMVRSIILMQLCIEGRFRLSLLDFCRQ